VVLFLVVLNHDVSYLGLIRLLIVVKEMRNTTERGPTNSVQKSLPATHSTLNDALMNTA
jgi:hypothetical protein